MKIITASINVDLIKESMLIKGKKGRYLPISVTMFDERDKFENDCSITLEQSKEDREAKKPRLYFGNGRVVFNSEQQASAPPYSMQPKDESNELPF